MLHKRYNYRKPLFWAVVFLVLVLRTNTISQSNAESDHFSTTATISSIQKVPGVILTQEQSQQYVEDNYP
jgi:hypothetical protein